MPFLDNSEVGLYSSSSFAELVLAIDPSALNNDFEGVILR
jgi:hypothetical protein